MSASSSSSSSSYVSPCPNRSAQDVINYALTMIAQTSRSIVAGLPSGAGELAPWSIAPTDQMLLWATESQERLARLCVPILDTATYTVSTAGTPVLASYSQIITGSGAPSISPGRALHRPKTVKIGAASLSMVDPAFLDTPWPWYPPTGAGDPTAWSDTNSQIQLSAYTTTPTFAILGYYLPAPLTTTTQCIDPAFDDYSIMAMGWYVAWRTAIKNADNSVIAQRTPALYAEWANAVKEIYTRLIGNASGLSSFFQPQPIDAMVQVVKQIRPAS